MGIPKFFRWISERYPLTSQLITPNSIPTFDNLYLDMNGIIHNCSHPPSSEDDPHYRITEEQMVLAIFAYIDHLFTKIKPRKVFFMAVDGVAPRAKMNQQRSRRFRTAREAKEMREIAEAKGEALPEEKAFDSNCITPGTPFMARLSKHLEYFINKKISEDADWREVQVVLSGHDVPGEGEHKIQEYIRLSKAQPGYNPNSRHCLYGLDADLVMLGLASHDPHFCLLREEVTFGRTRKKHAGLAQQNFFLLHLSLLREYLDLEFSSISEELPFEYDLERIIDDFILLSVFVGNDFLPHLPNLHINEGAMEEIWGIYKRVLPVAGGYLNTGGTINLARLQLVLDELAKSELEIFEKEYADLNWFKQKQSKVIAAMESARTRGKLVLTKDQKALFEKIRTFVEEKNAPGSDAKLALENKFPARDRRFIQELCDALHIELAWDEVDENAKSIVVIRPGSHGGDSHGGEDEEDDELDEDEESKEAINRVFAQYEKAKVVDNTVEDFEESYESKLNEKMDAWKKTYYSEKLEFTVPEDVSQLAYKYVEGLQWVMNYYYKGCSSWGWFYPYHYAPRITDLKNLKDMEFPFVKGKPFHPFEQLMGVLPALSKEHVPPAYRDLMYEVNSPIIDFYPEDFQTDMNGKKQDWEAIVKIPFIEEERLLKAMQTREHRLTPEERGRNELSIYSKAFVYDEDQHGAYPSSFPGLFPELAASKYKCRAKPFHLPELGDGVELISGLLKGVHLGASGLAGFPSMKTLPHTAQLGYHGVNVHGQDSKNQSMVISIENAYEGIKTADVAAKMVGQRTFLYWPFLQEGLVVAVSDQHFRYEKQSRNVVPTPHEPQALGQWARKAERIEGYYSKRFGIITGDVSIMLHVRPLRGLKRMDTGAFIKDYEGADKETEQAVQMAVQQVICEDERYLEQAAPSLLDEFPTGTKVIFLGEKTYGVAAQVQNVTEKSLDLAIAFFPQEVLENATYTKIVTMRPSERYQPSFMLARSLGISSLALSRITSSLLVELSDNAKLNIGLSLKFESKGLKMLGYTRKNDRGWEYSQQAYRLLQKYIDAFPVVFEHLDGQDRGLTKARDMFEGEAKPDQKVKEIRAWLKAEGVLALEPVTLFAEQLEKETIVLVEKTADNLNSKRDKKDLKKALIKGIPRQAVLKPAHAEFRLQGQIFGLGDRVLMAQDAGMAGVPLSMRGTAVGLNATSMDVVWDSPFMGGETLNGRCSEHRGSTVPFSSCLNLTRPQFVVSHLAPSARAVGQAPAFRPRIGPSPAVPGQHFRPAPGYGANVRPPVQLMTNPARGGGVRPQMQYAPAAKGLKPSAPAPSTVAPNGVGNHRQDLQAVLSGRGTSRGRGTPVQRGGGGHVVPATINPIQLLSRPPQANSAPAADGAYFAAPPAPPVMRPHGAPPASSAPGARGRGGHRGRGRGRGGGVPVQAAQAA